MLEIQASKDATENAKRFTCPALRTTIKDKEIAEVMSNELMATIRNNGYIPDDKRYNIIDQINTKTRQETEMKKQFQEIEKSIDLLIAVARADNGVAIINGDSGNLTLAPEETSDEYTLSFIMPNSNVNVLVKAQADPANNY